MLRTFFVRLSENQSLRNFAEHSALGHRVSGRFVAGTEIDDAVRADMEGSPYTQRTLDFVHELHRMPGNANSVGTVIQSYLKRSESDIEKLLAEGIRIRLCKGAYKEPASIAFESKADV